MKDIMQKEISDMTMMQYRSNYNILVATHKPLKDREDVYVAYDLMQDAYRFSATLRFILCEAYPNPDVDW